MRKIILATLAIFVVAAISFQTEVCNAMQEKRDHRVHIPEEMLNLNAKRVQRVREHQSKLVTQQQREEAALRAKGLRDKAMKKDLNTGGGTQ